MVWLLENPLPIYAVGGVLALLCGLAFLARRTMPSLLALVGVLLSVALLVIVERMVVTDREQVEQTVEAMFDAIKANDQQAVLRFVDPQAAGMQTNLPAIMPLVRVDDAGASQVEVDVDRSVAPPRAEARLRAKFMAVHLRSGMRIAYFDRVTLGFVLRDGQWRLADYTVMYQGRAIDPVESLRGARAAPR